MPCSEPQISPSDSTLLFEAGGSIALQDCCGAVTFDGRKIEAMRVRRRQM